MSNKRTVWLDLLKAFAILLVMADHTYQVLYNREAIHYLTYCNVPLFIFAMGASVYMADRKYFDKEKTDVFGIIKKILHRIIKIFIPYMFASLVFFMFYFRHFELFKYLKYVFHFNISGPLYYVFLYIQLVIISPFIMKIISMVENKKNEILLEIVTGIVLMGIAIVTTNFTGIAGIYGGGGKVFGGTFLVILYIGMIFMRYTLGASLTMKKALAGLTASMLVLIVCVLFIAKNKLEIETMLPFGKGINPPGLSLMIYALFVFILFYFIGMVLEHCPNMAYNIYLVIAKLGRHTLYIFMYHRMFIDFIFPAVASVTDILDRNAYVRAILYFVIMIGGSLAIEYFFAGCRKIIIMSVNGVKKNIIHS